MGEVVPEVLRAIGDGSTAALVVGAAVLIIGWYRRQATDAEEFHGGRIDSLTADFDAYRARTDAELAQHRVELDACRGREAGLLIVERELRAEVNALRARINQLPGGSDQ